MTLAVSSLAEHRTLSASSSSVSSELTLSVSPSESHRPFRERQGLWWPETPGQPTTTSSCIGHVPAYIPQSTALGEAGYGDTRCVCTAPNTQRGTSSVLDLRQLTHRPSEFRPRQPGRLAPLRDASHPSWDKTHPNPALVVQQCGIWTTWWAIKRDLPANLDNCLWCCKHCHGHRPT